jgi:hypothetical protein
MRQRGEKMKEKESPSSGSAAELAQALTEALQKNTATRGVARQLVSGSVAQTEVDVYTAIKEDLTTLDLSS